MKINDKQVYRYHEYLKEMYLETQYIEPINIREVIKRHKVSNIISTTCIEMGIYQPVYVNGRQIHGRYTWITNEPSVDLAIALVEGCRKKKKTNKPLGYWQERKYLFGLFTIRKWIPSK
jgi:hypothetical protein